MSHFSERLKLLRQQQQLTMQTLADKAEVSKSMICKIERDEVQPTLDVAARIANALGKSLSEMLHAPQHPKVILLKKHEQACWEDGQHIKRRNISPILDGLKIEWLLVELPPGLQIEKSATSFVKNTGKFLLVHQGELEIHIEDQIYHLTTGDSIYFDHTTHHILRNVTDKPAEYFILIQHE